MHIEWIETAWDEYLYWQANNTKLIKKINELIKDIQRNGPYSGIGKPELLKGDLSGYYSRRIDDKNRLVYIVKDDNITIFQCGSHYKDK